MSHVPYFFDRLDAGAQLAKAVLTEINHSEIPVAPRIVYALPRGGLPIAEPIARSLKCPLDIVIAKKVTRPENPELAIGAVTADGHVLRSRQAPFTLWQGDSWRSALQEAQTKAEKQLAQFASYRPAVTPGGAIVFLVDDGIATGMTMAVAARALRAKNPAQLWICAPVAPLKILDSLKQWSDRQVILQTPEEFQSVSRFYTKFPQVEMEEAIACLERQQGDQGSPSERFASRDRVGD